ncbi:MAG: hypothetical protein R3192_03065 [Woeseiaceae bacterium]|nr:hypothetical protein [Woeseiaceae bacterium]
MLEEISQLTVIVFGIAVFAGAVLGLVLPAKLMHIVYTTATRSWGIYLAVVLRLLLGAALIVASPASRFSLFFETLGWIAIIAAIGIMLMGRARMRQFVLWFKDMRPAWIRALLIFGIALGALLVYGAIP